MATKAKDVLINVKTEIGNSVSQLNKLSSVFKSSKQPVLQLKDANSEHLRELAKYVVTGKNATDQQRRFNEAVKDGAFSQKALTGELKKLSKENELANKSIGKSGLGAELKSTALSYLGWGAAITGTISILKQSITESLEASRVAALVKTNIENAGFSYKEYGEKIDSVAKKNISLGFSDEETSQSLSKLLLLTGNYSDALTILATANDLARSKNISLEESTKLISLALQGNTRSLREYGIVVNDGATSTEILRAIFEKTKGQADEFAKSTAGQASIVKEKWKEALEQTGDLLIKFGTTASKVLFKVGDAIGGTLGTIAGAVIYGVNPEADLYTKGITGTKKDKKEGAAATTPAPTIGQVKNKKSQDELDAAAEKAKNIREKFLSLKDKVKESRVNITDDLDKLKNSFVNKLQDISKSIDNARDSLKELDRSFAEAQSGRTDSLADKIISTERKKNEILKQLSKERDSEKRAELQEELSLTEKSLSDANSFIQSNSGAVTEARRKAGLSELALDIENYNKTNQLESQKYNESRAKIEQQISELQTQAFQETEIYRAKTTALNTIQTEADKKWKEFSESRKVTIEKEVDAEIKKFQELLDLISRVNSAAGVSSPVFAGAGAKSTPSVSIGGKRASGGSVTAGTNYLVGEKGAEIFNPSRSGSIVANDKIGGNTSVVINVNGASNPDKIANEIMNKLKRITNIGVA